MGIQHFSGLFVLLCVGVAGALLTLLGEHAFFKFILPHLRHQQRFKYWLHTSQKIHRALNLGCEDESKSEVESSNRCSTLCLSENCNLHRLPPSAPTSSSPEPSTSSASPSSSTTKWNNQSAKAGREAKDHNKHVHFNLETLNSYQLQAPPPGSERGRRGLVGSPPTQLCSNGGPNLSLSLVLSPPACPGGSSPWEEELRELQGRIEEFRGQLRAALARRAELQRTVVRQRLGQSQTSNLAESDSSNTLTKDINRAR